MSKPIEPGCRAVIINSICGNDGIIVNVIASCGISYFSGGGMSGIHEGWRIDKYLKRPSGSSRNEVAANQLQRIDDYDGNDVISWEDERCVWQPEKVAV